MNYFLEKTIIKRSNPIPDETSAVVAACSVNKTENKNDTKKHSPRLFK
jgi:hypothetical protein